MITVHETEIARQNNTVNIFWDPPKNDFSQIMFSGEPMYYSVRTLLTRMAILTSFCV